MKAYFKELKWNKGSRELVQGVKGNRIPHNAISGGNGSFVCETPAELRLTVQTEDEREISWNIISVVRAVNSWVRLTQGRVDALETALSQTKEFEIDDRDYIVDLGNYVLI